MDLERISRRSVYKGHIIELFEDTMKFANGNTSKWDFIHHGGASAVVAVTEKNTLLMVRQYRPGTDRLTLEIPAGCCNEGEDGMTTAARELEEETGFHCQNIVHLTDMYSAAAYDDECVKIYLATGLSKTGQNLDEDEYLSVEEYPLDTLVQMILNQQIKDSKTMVGILAYYAQNQKTPIK